MGEHGGDDPQPSGRRALLLLLPRDPGSDRGCALFRAATLPGRRNHVRRPDRMDRPRPGRAAAAARGFQTMTLISGPEQWYLVQLRVLGAWWRLGSSALEPYLLLPYSLAQLKRDSLDRPLNRQ